jgi:hypothetical protein
MSSACLLTSLNATAPARAARIKKGKQEATAVAPNQLPAPQQLPDLEKNASCDFKMPKTAMMTKTAHAAGFASSISLPTAGLSRQMIPSAVAVPLIFSRALILFQISGNGTSISACQLLVHVRYGYCQVTQIVYGRPVFPVLSNKTPRSRTNTGSISGKLNHFNGYSPFCAGKTTRSNSPDSKTER